MSKPPVVTVDVQRYAFHGQRPLCEIMGAGAQFEPRQNPLLGTPDCGSNVAPPEESRCIEIDARGLEPPMPMVRILETIEALSGEIRVLARTDRRPFFLLEELPRRGFSGQTEEAPDGSYNTHIRRA